MSRQLTKEASFLLQPLKARSPEQSLLFRKAAFCWGDLPGWTIAFSSQTAYWNLLTCFQLYLSQSLPSYACFLAWVLTKKHNVYFLLTYYSFMNIKGGKNNNQRQSIVYAQIFLLVSWPQFDNDKIPQVCISCNKTLTNVFLCRGLALHGCDMPSFSVVLTWAGSTWCQRELTGSHWGDPQTTP